MVKPSQSERTLQTLSTDLFELIKIFNKNEEITSMHSYRLMQRVLNEQCHIVSDDDGEHVTVKKPKEIPSDSLQNPSDPDSSYSGHKGQGYQVQVIETFTKTENKNEKEQTLNLITSVRVEKACAHDSAALIPAIEAAEKLDLGPKTVLADSLYGSDDNVEAAKALDVKVVAPAMPGGLSGGIGLDDFRFGRTRAGYRMPGGSCSDRGKIQKKEPKTFCQLCNGSLR